MNIQPFYVIGISVRTTNENEQAVKDIPALWARFFEEKIAEKIPGKTDASLYCIYTDYEKDHTKPYTTILGCRVENLDAVPPGMVGKVIEGGNYDLRTAKGNIQEGLVYVEWLRIWDSMLPRTYTADFEVYGEKAKDPHNAEVDIFVAVR